MKYMLARLTVVIAILVPGGLGATELCADFQALLKGEAPIRYFKIGFSNLFRADQKPIPGWVYYEGSIQNDTFWIRNCTNSPNAPAILMPGWLVGMSHKDNWGYSNDRVSLSARGASIPSALDKRAEQVMDVTEQALGLGASVSRGSFKLLPNNDFQAEVKSGGTIKGHFEVSPDGRPLRCEYSGEQWPDARAVVTYAYTGAAEKSCLPTSLKYEAFGKLRALVHVEEYQFAALELGEASVPPEGYTIESLT